MKQSQFYAFQQGRNADNQFNIFGDALIWSVVMLLNASASFHDASAARDVDFEITEILGRMPVCGSFQTFYIPQRAHLSKTVN